MLTQQHLRELLNYEPETGAFTWRVSTGNKVKAGDVAGCFDSEGYARIYIGGKLYRAHRLAWLYVYGSWPADQIDHINRNRSDNRLSNLREADNSQNAHNHGLLATNKSGVTGVHYDKKNRCWVAAIRIDGRRKFLYSGDFNSAVAIRREAEESNQPRRPH